MDFWKTQTAMHHSLENQGEREKGFGVKPEGEWLQRDIEENINGHGMKSKFKVSDEICSLSLYHLPK